MVTRENFKLTPVRELPVATVTGALHVSFEGGIHSLFIGHLSSAHKPEAGKVSV